MYLNSLDNHLTIWDHERHVANAHDSGALTDDEFDQRMAEPYIGTLVHDPANQYRVGLVTGADVRGQVIDIAMVDGSTTTGQRADDWQAQDATAVACPWPRPL